MFASSVLVTTILGWVVARSVYRLYFHPQAYSWTQMAGHFYFDVIKGGKFIWETERLHKIYGLPLIRINPHEVHINDPDYYQEVYAAISRRRENDAIYIHVFGLPGSSFSTINADLHLKRRGPLNELFSKNAITDIVPLIQEKVERLMFHLEEGFRSKKVIHIDSGFFALTADVIHHYMYGYSENNIEMEDFDHTARDGINGMFRSHHVLYFFPILLHLESLPVKILKRINIHIEALTKQKKCLYNKAVEAAQAFSTSEGYNKTRNIDVLVNPDNFSVEERDPVRLKNESMSLITAGTETAGRALDVATFYICSNSHILRRMRAELIQVMPEPNSKLTCSPLEQLPYLVTVKRDDNERHKQSAVVNESFRMASGTSGRFSRTAPTEALVYNEIILPPGVSCIPFPISHFEKNESKTPISSSNHLMLRHPKIFPDPDSFDPDRWIRATAKGERLEKFFVNFSKGSRSCLGRHLIRCLHLEIYDTPQANIECGCDFGVPYPEQGNLSVCTLITGLV
ncbi:hypothetical protein N7493_004878 [Penicillium malachiteum]|uniref:Cytochrome P450 n=1 Tax=Penicillium malachiteum TaxID=1324776 RepID=A0AAD6HLV1_9EURO|nr:hypothetical protein N7493_004878 [Penicillium malachiteum]